MSKKQDEQNEFVAKVICDEYQIPQAERVARIFLGAGIDSVAFWKMTSGNFRADSIHPPIVVASHIQTAVGNEMRDLELGLEMRREMPAWVTKKKKHKK